MLDEKTIRSLAARIEKSRKRSMLDENCINPRIC